MTRCGGFNCTYLVDNGFKGRDTHGISRGARHLVLNLTMLPGGPFGADILRLCGSFIYNRVRICSPRAKRLFGPSSFASGDNRPGILDRSAVAGCLGQPGGGILVRRRLVDCAAFVRRRVPRVRHRTNRFSLDRVAVSSISLAQGLGSAGREIRTCCTCSIIDRYIVNTSCTEGGSRVLILSYFESVFQLMRHGN